MSKNSDRTGWILDYLVLQVYSKNSARVLIILETIKEIWYYKLSQKVWENTITILTFVDYKEWHKLSGITIRL